jgi:hypothetical protein
LRSRADHVLRPQCSARAQSEQKSCPTAPSPNPERSGVSAGAVNTVSKGTRSPVSFPPIATRRLDATFMGLRLSTVLPHRLGSTTPFRTTARLVSAPSLARRCATAQTPQTFFCLLLVSKTSREDAPSLQNCSQWLEAWNTAANSFGVFPRRDGRSAGYGCLLRDSMPRL